MRLVFLLLIFLSALASINTYASSKCVGLAEQQYCLGEPPPNKPASGMDEGIYWPKMTGKLYSFEPEQDHVNKLQIHTSVTVQNGQVVKVHQSYFVDGSSKDKALNLFRFTLAKLKKRYGEPAIERTSFASWKNSPEVTLTNDSSESISAAFRLPVN